MKDDQRIEDEGLGGHKTPPASDTGTEYRELAAQLARDFALTGDETALTAGLERLSQVAATWGLTVGLERDRADRDRRNDMFMTFVKHPAYATSYGVALRLAHADRTYEEIKTVLDAIGQTPTMDETAGEMAVALFRQGHTPTSVAMHLLNSSGMRGRA